MFGTAVVVAAVAPASAVDPAAAADVPVGADASAPTAVPIRRTDSSFRPTTPPPLPPRLSSLTWPPAAFASPPPPPLPSRDHQSPTVRKWD